MLPDAQTGKCEHRIRAGSRPLLAHTVLAAEFIDTPSGINDLLFASIERVAYGTHIDVQLLRQGRLCLKFVATAANDLDLVVLRMNVGFHDLVRCLVVSRFCRKGAGA